MGVLFNILIVMVVIATIICLCFYLCGLIIMFEKDELPDMEDV